MKWCFRAWQVIALFTWLCASSTRHLLFSAEALAVLNGQPSNVFCVASDTPVGTRAFFSASFNIALHRLHFR